jgi:hypothetical protein
LQLADDQMDRAEQIHELCHETIGQIAGTGAVNVRKALRDLLTLTRTPLTFTNDFEADMLRQMHVAFPQKAAYVGEAGLRLLIQEAVTEARQYGFETPRQKTLLVVLKFSFGHGCTADPLYPWIANTLRDERIVTPAARAARLEKKAVTWLEHVVARNEQGSHE